MKKKTFLLIDDQWYLKESTTFEIWGSAVERATEIVRLMDDGLGLRMKESGWCSSTKIVDKDEMIMIALQAEKL